ELSKRGSGGRLSDTGERARELETRCHPERTDVNATGVCSEGHVPYPGRSARWPGHARLGGAARRRDGKQKSAEAKKPLCRRRRAEHREPNWLEAIDE